MNGRNSSVMLIPLLGFLALFYPIATQRTSTTPGAGRDEPRMSRARDHPRTGSKKSAWHGDREILDEFLGLEPDDEARRQSANQTWPDEDRRKNFQIDFLIVTVPDPIDSGLPYMFDRFMSSIQAAIAADDYALDRFDMPWLDQAEKVNQNENKNGESKGSNSENSVQLHGGSASRRFVSEPGVILFRRHTEDASWTEDESPNPTDGARRRTRKKAQKVDGRKPDVLLLYVVGETPTGGMQKLALAAALDEIKWFRSRREDENDPYPAQYPSAPPGPVRIMGPTFSGSVESMQFVLSRWLSSYRKSERPTLKIISGSATSVTLHTITKATLQADTPVSLSGEISTSERPPKRMPVVLEKDTEVTLDKGIHVSLSQGTAVTLQMDASVARQEDGSVVLRKDTPIALEGDTFFTDKFSAVTIPDRVTLDKVMGYFTKIEPDLQKGKVALLVEANTAYGRAGKEQTEAQVTTIPFPLHVSQLRAASERQKTQQQQAKTQVTFQAPMLDLPLEDADERQDSIRELSKLDLPSAELILANLLSTISRDQFRFVGIMATDARDTMFLAQEVREHNPEAVLFTLNPDLLYLHPQINTATRGMLVFSSYPLFNSNQLWSFPNPTSVRLQFPDQGAEGAYNATLALLDARDLLVEYGVPFIIPTKDACCPTWPPLWITVVGRDGLWPLKYEKIDKENVVVQTSNSAERTRQYMYPLPTEGIGGTDSTLKSAWAYGMYPQTTILTFVFFSCTCSLFAFAIALTRVRKFAINLPKTENPNAPCHEFVTREPYLNVAAEGPLTRLFGATAFPQFRRQAELYVLGAILSLGSFQFIVLLGLVLPAIGIRWTAPPPRASVAGFLCILTLGLLALAAKLSLQNLNVPAAGDRSEEQRTKSAEKAPARRILTLSVTCLLGGMLWLALSWRPRPTDSADASAALFTGLRLLNLQSGVSPLPPLFFISMVAFLLAFNSFRRMRQIECLDSWQGIFCSETGSLSGMCRLEEDVQRYLHCRSIYLPGAVVVVAATFASGFYLFGQRLVRSFDTSAFYFLLGVSFTLVNTVLWLGVLRFWHVWRALQALLRQLSWHPLRASYKSYRTLFPAMSKIDLTASSATVAALAYSVEQARCFWQLARFLPPARSSVVLEQPQVKAATASTGGPTGSSNGRNEKVAPETSTNAPTEDLLSVAERAHRQLNCAMEADAAGHWGEAFVLERQSMTSLAKVSKEVTGILEESEWLGREAVLGRLAGVAEERRDPILHAGQVYLVTRLVHFLACVFPQLQSLVYSSAAGLMLMLVAISSYPFQPRGLLLFFSWAVILSFVGIAMTVFVQMNRDAVLSSLNGTKAGQVSWDREFVVRLFFYGVVPVLALLGAQFPESVGEIIVRILPAAAGHP